LRGSWLDFRSAPAGAFEPRVPLRGLLRESACGCRGALQLRAKALDVVVELLVTTKDLIRAPTDLVVQLLVARPAAASAKASAA
jgi:hypothetical protein